MKLAEILPLIGIPYSIKTTYWKLNLRKSSLTELIWGVIESHELLLASNHKLPEARESQAPQRGGSPALRTTGPRQAG